MSEASKSILMKAPRTPHDSRHVSLHQFRDISNEGSAKKLSSRRAGCRREGNRFSIGSNVVVRLRNSHSVFASVALSGAHSATDPTNGNQ